ncbi:protein FAM90A5-like [Glossophaga mutica]
MALYAQPAPPRPLSVHPPQSMVDLGVLAGTASPIKAQEYRSLPRILSAPGRCTASGGADPAPTVLRIRWRTKHLANFRGHLLGSHIHQVKCKDCGAFGHKASNIRCPLKCWDGALPPQALGSHKKKENRKLCSPRESGNPGSSARPAKEKEQRPRSSLSCFVSSYFVLDGEEILMCYLLLFFLQHPNQPVLVHTAKRRYVGDTGLTSRSPVRKPDEASTASPIHRAESSTFPPWVLSKGQGLPVTGSHHPAGTGFVQGPGSKPHGPGHALIPRAQAKHPGMRSPSVGHAAAHSSGLDSKVSPKAPGKRAAQSPVQTFQNPQKQPRLSPCPSPQKTTPRADPGCVQPVLPPASVPALRPALAPQAPRKTPAQGQSVDLQPPPKGPLLSTVYTCSVSQQPLAPQRPSQPLRMVFRKLKRGQWSSRFLTTPSVLPAEEPASPAQSPPSPGMSEGPCARIPWSVLYEDLQAFSSSEDSDGQ